MVAARKEVRAVTPSHVVTTSAALDADKPSLLVLIPFLWFGLPTLLLHELFGAKGSLSFVSLGLLPRLLWRSSQPAEGPAFTLANLIYWNLVYPIFFGSPLFVGALCALRPTVALPLLVCYVVFIKLISRPNLKDGQPWRFFSAHDWGIVALRRFMRLRLHVTKGLQQRPVEKPVVVAIHPHGVASDYRVAMDGLLYGEKKQRRRRRRRRRRD